MKIQVGNSKRVNSSRLIYINFPKPN